MSGKSLLVVDDDRLVLNDLRRMLESAGYRVATEETAENALEYCALFTPDLAIVDLKLPGMSGQELGRRLRYDCGVPFLCLSAYVEEETIQTLAQSGALGYLVKPAGEAQILATVESALARAAEIAALRRRESGLSEALDHSRAISAAVGILMERHRLTQAEAFARLRGLARSQRMKIGRLAGQIIAAAERLNLPPR
ncbi:MAG: ANTAR domain-containing response regulator [Gammaproteobacteria bacterium]